MTSTIGMIKWELAWKSKQIELKKQHPEIAEEISKGIHNTRNMIKQLISIQRRREEHGRLYC